MAYTFNPFTGTFDYYQAGTTTYPGAGIPVSTGSAWSTSKTTPSGAIVGDTDTQTLSGKTLTTPKIAKIVVPSDGTTAHQVTKADGSTVVTNVDTTNSRLGIGTASPAASVEAVLTTAGENLRLTSTYSTGYPFVSMWGPSSRLAWFGMGNASHALEFVNEAASGVIYFKIGSTARLIVNNNGTITISAYPSVTLATDASGNILTSSDERLKTDIKPFKAGLAEVLSVTPVIYNWSAESGFDTTNRYAGFTAQDVEKAIPEAVGINADGGRSVSDRPLIAALFNAVRELSEELAALRKKLKLPATSRLLPNLSASEIQARRVTSTQKK